MRNFSTGRPRCLRPIRSGRTPAPQPRPGQSPFAPDAWDVGPPHPDPIAAPAPPVRVAPAVAGPAARWGVTERAGQDAACRAALAVSRGGRRTGGAPQPVLPLQAAPAGRERGVIDAAILRTLAEAAGLPKISSPAPINARWRSNSEWRCAQRSKA